MSDSDSKNPNSKRLSDPRLKSFLRQARAVISMERGFNQRSQLKLQSLAESLKLPDDLFQVALEQLKNAQKPSEISHWERGFINFLDRELGKYQQKILTVNMQNRALEIAKNKYQLTETRALQLISECAEKRGLTRITVAEARRFVEELVADRVGEKRDIDKELQDQIYKSASTWGLSREEFDRRLSGKLNANRALFRRQRIVKSTGILMSIVVIGTAFAAIHYDWAAKLKKMFQPDLEVVSDPETESKTPLVGDSNHAANLVWLDSELKQRVQTAKDQIPEISFGLTKLESASPDERRMGYSELFTFVCKGDGANNRVVESLVTSIYFRDPDLTLSRQASEQLGSKLLVDKESLSINIDRFETGFRANAALVRLGFHHPENPTLASGARRQYALDQINKAVGTDISSTDQAAYLQQAEAALATEQWNYVVQNCWSSPSRFAAHVQPLYDLTANKMDRTLANQFRQRAIEAILDIEPGRWSDLKEPIRQAIAVADQTRINDWIREYLSIDNRDFSDFLARELLKKTDVKSALNERGAIKKALSDYRSSLQRKILEPVLSRNYKVGRLSAQAINATKLQQETVSPDVIAKLAFATNASLSVASLSRQEVWDYSFFDSNFSSELPILRDEVPMAARQTTPLEATGSTASASENRRKTELIEKLSNFENLATSARKTVVEQLAELASRFKHISYTEASTLAKYMLSEMPLEEWLNVEKNIDAFKPWPNFALALADQMPDSQVGLDQAVTVYRLLFPGQFELENPESWNEEISRRIYESVYLEMKQRTPADNSTVVDWQRLKSYLERTHEQRSRLLRSLFSIEPTHRPHSDSLPSINCLETLLADRNMSRAASERSRRLVSLIRDGEESEMVKTLMAEHVLFEMLAERMIESFPNKKLDVDRMRAELESAARTRPVGKRLELIELQLLRLSDIFRIESVNVLYSRS